MGSHSLDALSVYVASLGCAKNLVDTEMMLGAMVESGMSITDDPEMADVILVNTCSFIEQAREESIDTILDLSLCKTNGRARVLLVTGCLAQRYPEELMAEMPEVDGIVGVGDWPELVSVLEQCLKGRRVKRVSRVPAVKVNRRSRIITTGSFTAYVKVAEGCDNRCHYCAIPSIRGSLVSREPQEVAAEVGSLAEAGVREVILIAQDLTAYGRDQGSANLEGLLKTIMNGPRPPWLRLLYCYVTGITPGLVDLMKSGAVCRYLDIPIQHGSEVVLEAMGRRGKPERYLKTIEHLRRDVPGVTLRSSFMIGHPGETEGAFRQLLEFLKAARLDRVGFFQYSREDGTPSASRDDHVPEGIALERLREAVALQADLARQADMERIGSTVSFLVNTQGKTLEGRLEGQAPDVDGIATLRWSSPNKPKPGDIVQVCVTGAKDGNFSCRP